MFQIAKSVTTTCENVDVKVVDTEIGHIDYENHKVIKSKTQELEISISGNVDSEEYCMHFIISKPITEYIGMKKI